MEASIKRKFNLIFILIILLLFKFNIVTNSLTSKNQNNSYNRELSVEYALKWSISSNNQYYNYVNDGGDCTNFVSQALRAGGIKFVGSKANATSIKSWFYYSPNLPNRTHTWTAAEPFHLHFREENQRSYRYREYKIIDALNNWDEICMNLYPGDIVQYARTNNIAFHSQVITELISDRKVVYFCQHSNTMANFIRNGKLKYYLIGKPNNYNFYIYNIKNDNSVPNDIKSLIYILTEEDYRKELIDALSIIKVSLEDTRFDIEENNIEETNDFVEKMNRRIEEVEFNMNTRLKSSKELLEFLISRENL